MEACSSTSANQDFLEFRGRRRGGKLEREDISANRRDFNSHRYASFTTVVDCSLSMSEIQRKFQRVREQRDHVLVEITLLPEAIDSLQPVPVLRSRK